MKYHSETNHREKRGLNMDPIDRIKTVISENEIVLFMKGTPSVSLNADSQ